MSFVDGIIVVVSRVTIVRSSGVVPVVVHWADVDGGGERRVIVGGAGGRIRTKRVVVAGGVTALVNVGGQRSLVVPRVVLRLEHDGPGHLERRAVDLLRPEELDVPTVLAESEGLVLREDQEQVISAGAVCGFEASYTHCVADSDALKPAVRSNPAVRGLEDEADGKGRSTAADQAVGPADEGLHLLECCASKAIFGEGWIDRQGCSGEPAGNLGSQSSNSVASAGADGDGGGYVGSHVGRDEAILVHSRALRAQFSPCDLCVAEFEVGLVDAEDDRDAEPVGLEDGIPRLTFSPFRRHDHHRDVGEVQRSPPDHFEQSVARRIQQSCLHVATFCRQDGRPDDYLLGSPAGFMCGQDISCVYIEYDE
ncbi:lytic murein transglycosylase [Babesia caballi]|uniref:Lytic murein transglycosylase n=1 Tax=Babesia caballi TaxID=5871 RepID=A0AAV4M2Q4_BABCB|nr:lytic murein transglycosylase [Babesia caballi]